MKIRILTVALGALALAGAALFPSPSRSPLDRDYTSIPPDPAQRHAALAGAPITLAKAIELAQQQSGGLATAAQGALDGTFELELFSPTVRQRVKLDASGKVVVKDELPRFPGEAVSGEWTETPTGLKYFDIKIGTGQKPEGPASRVKVHYTGWLVDGQEIDSSRRRNQPVTRPLNSFIAGWTEGVGSMQVGGKRKLIVPYALGYGERGQPPSIPARATLIFDVELLEIVR
jgi:peptidylprolyl isomerase